jgi:hypothetical protein
LFVGLTFVVHAVIYGLYGAAQDTHGYFLIRYAIDIVALSTDLLLAGL